MPGAFYSAMERGEEASSLLNSTEGGSGENSPALNESNGCTDESSPLLNGTSRSSDLPGVPSPHLDAPGQGLGFPGASPTEPTDAPALVLINEECPAGKEAPSVSPGVEPAAPAPPALSFATIPPKQDPDKEGSPVLDEGGPGKEGIEGGKDEGTADTGGVEMGSSSEVRVSPEAKAAPGGTAGGPQEGHGAGGGGAGASDSSPVPRLSSTGPATSDGVVLTAPVPAPDGSGGPVGESSTAEAEPVPLSAEPASAAKESTGMISLPFPQSYKSADLLNEEEEEGRGREGEEGLEGVFEASGDSQGAAEKPLLVGGGPGGKRAQEECWEEERGGGAGEGEGDRYSNGGYEEEGPIEWLGAEASQQSPPPGAGAQEEDTFFPRHYMSTVIGMPPRDDVTGDVAAQVGLSDGTSSVMVCGSGSSGSSGSSSAHSLHLRVHPLCRRQLAFDDLGDVLSEDGDAGWAYHDDPTVIPSPLDRPLPRVMAPASPGLSPTSESSPLFSGTHPSGGRAPGGRGEAGGDGEGGGAQGMLLEPYRFPPSSVLEGFPEQRIDLGAGSGIPLAHLQQQQQQQHQRQQPSLFSAPQQGSLDEFQDPITLAAEHSRPPPAWAAMAPAGAAPGGSLEPSPAPSFGPPSGVPVHTRTHPHPWLPEALQRISHPEAASALGVPLAQQASPGEAAVPRFGAFQPGPASAATGALEAQASAAPAAAAAARAVSWVLGEGEAGEAELGPSAPLPARRAALQGPYSTAAQGVGTAVDQGHYVIPGLQLGDTLGVPVAPAPMPGASTCQYGEQALCRRCAQEIRMLRTEVYSLKVTQRAYELELARAVQARLQAEGTLSKLIAALQQQQAQQAQQHQQQQQSLQQQQLSQLHGQEQWLLQPGMHALPMGVHAARTHMTPATGVHPGPTGPFAAPLAAFPGSTSGSASVSSTSVEDGEGGEDAFAVPAGKEEGEEGAEGEGDGEEEASTVSPSGRAEGRVSMSPRQGGYQPRGTAGSHDKPWEGQQLRTPAAEEESEGAGSWIRRKASYTGGTPKAPSTAATVSLGATPPAPYAATPQSAAPLIAGSTAPAPADVHPSAPAIPGAPVKRGAPVTQPLLVRCTNLAAAFAQAQGPGPAPGRAGATASTQSGARTALGTPAQAAAAGGGIAHQDDGTVARPVAPAGASGAPEAGTASAPPAAPAATVGGGAGVGSRGVGSGGGGAGARGSKTSRGARGEGPQHRREGLGARAGGGAKGGTGPQSQSQSHSQSQPPSQSQALNLPSPVVDIVSSIVAEGTAVLPSSPLALRPSAEASPADVLCSPPLPPLPLPKSISVRAPKPPSGTASPFSGPSPPPGAAHSVPQKVSADMPEAGAAAGRGGVAGEAGAGTPGTRLASGGMGAPHGARRTAASPERSRPAQGSEGGRRRCGVPKERPASASSSSSSSREAHSPERGLEHARNTCGARIWGGKREADSAKGSAFASALAPTSPAPAGTSSRLLREWTTGTGQNGQHHPPSQQQQQRELGRQLGAIASADHPPGVPPSASALRRGGAGTEERAAGQGKRGGTPGGTPASGYTTPSPSGLEGGVPLRPMKGSKNGRGAAGGRPSAGGAANGSGSGVLGAGSTGSTGPASYSAKVLAAVGATAGLGAPGHGKSEACSPLPKQRGKAQAHQASRASKGGDGDGGEAAASLMGGLPFGVYDQGTYKTELCNKWEDTGSCPYGPRCQFAHGVEELRPVLRHPRYKTELCRMVAAGRTCPYGHRCHFRHAKTSAEQESILSLSP